MLENGPASPYARFFDIQLASASRRDDLDNRVLLPVLGTGETLENQELRLRYEDGAFLIDYYDHAYKILILLLILESPSAELSGRLGSEARTWLSCRAS